MKETKIKTVLYACSGNGKVNYKNTIYNDLFVDSDLKISCTEINYNNYDLIVASPPCNYWSRGNYRRYTSKYSLETKELLQFFINKANNTNIPFIIENVRNYPLFKKELNFKNLNIVCNGRHTYFSNKNIDFINNLKFEKSCNIQHISNKKRQGDKQVETVFNLFIEKYINENN